MPSDVTKAGTLVGSPVKDGPGEGPRSRRNVLKALGAAAAGAVASGMLSPTQALAHGGFHQDFNGSDPAIHGNNTGDGPGVEGTAVNGSGVIGESISSPGVFGNSDGGSGVVGRSHGGPGLEGFSDLGPGVLGISDDGAAVRGHTLHGRGIVGEAEFDGVGVLAFSSSGAGVMTESLEGDALYVLGRARFTMGGNRVIQAGQDAATVFHEGVTAKSHVTVTLNGDPGSVVSGSPAVVHWVERKPGLGFIVHLTRKVAQATPFSFLILELDF